jgi:hypothetical protein
VESADENSVTPSCGPNGKLCVDFKIPKFTERFWRVCRQASASWTCGGEFYYGVPEQSRSRVICGTKSWAMNA